MTVRLRKHREAAINSLVLIGFCVEVQVETFSESVSRTAVSDQVYKHNLGRLESVD